MAQELIVPHRAPELDGQGRLRGIANIQDRDSAPRLFAKLRREAALMRHTFATCRQIAAQSPASQWAGYAGPKLRGALVSLGRWTLKIIKRSDTATSFQALRPLSWFAGKPLTGRGWNVERTFAWLGRDHRLTVYWQSQSRAQTPRS
ncbi:MAG: hypothetical protein GW905_04580 [Rhodobacterales bacterium]|nr:hypothetical protein [Rhodobacterales bacterium]